MQSHYYWYMYYCGHSLRNLHCNTKYKMWYKNINKWNSIHLCISLFSIAQIVPSFTVQALKRQMFAAVVMRSAVAIVMAIKWITEKRCN
jgi:hypothetical protein